MPRYFEVNAKFANANARSLRVRTARSVANWQCKTRDSIQTRTTISKLWFRVPVRVLQPWRVEDKRAMYTAFTSERTVRLINRWNQLDQQAVGASIINAFKGRLSRIRETRIWVSSWTSPLSPMPAQWVLWLVRPHKVSMYRVYRPTLWRSLAFSWRTYDLSPLTLTSHRSSFSSSGDLVGPNEIHILYSVFSMNKMLSYRRETALQGAL